LLGLIVSNWGIEVNPVKITAITDMGAPATIKDVQKLTGCMAALNRFVSRLGERGLPFFKLLKCQDKFQCGGGRASLARPETSPSVSSGPYSTIGGGAGVLFSSSRGE
jgi:hypothetical protein